MQQKTQGMGSGPILSEKCCIINKNGVKNATCKQSFKHNRPNTIHLHVIFLPQLLDF